MTRRIFLASLASAPLAAAESWERAPFPDWSAGVVDRVLTDSPWAKPLTASFELQPRAGRFAQSFGPRPAGDVWLPGGGGWPGDMPGGGRPGGSPGRIPRTTGQGQGAPASVRTEVYLTLRWSSALPVRQAMALQSFGRDGLDSPKARKLLDAQEPEYVVEIFGLPAILATQGAGQVREELEKSASLSVKGRRPRRAASVEVPEHGMHLAATLRFARFGGVSPGDGDVLLTASAGPMEIEKRFRLKAMVYRGRLEL